MSDCEMCGINSEKCYLIDLTIKSDFNKDEQAFKIVLFVQNVKIK